jgi:zeaxanthin epoxidase
MMMTMQHHHTKAVVVGTMMLVMMMMMMMMMMTSMTDAWITPSTQPSRMVASSSSSGSTTPSSFSSWSFPSSSTIRTTTQRFVSSAATTTTITSNYDNDITSEHPLRVLIAGAGVGGLVLASTLSHIPHINVTVLEQTSQFKRFGGPIQLASNAMQLLKEMNSSIYQEIEQKFTVTGNKMNGIKDGIRTEWYTTFDLATPAEVRNMPYTGVIERPDLQQIYLNALPTGTVQNGDGVVSYTQNSKGNVDVTLNSGKVVSGDVLIGADGIWSAVRATMRNQPTKGVESGATYSGYTLFAGELLYDSFDHGQVGYKVYIGPKQYFVITDIGNGRYQWYAFLAREAGSASTLIKPNDSTSLYLQELFVNWSQEIHHILKATKEDEIEQRDLYDRPPSLLKPWYDQNVALLGDGIHAMMPNLGQGGCQAIEDAYVIAQELTQLKKRSDINAAFQSYQQRRFIRSAAVQGLSRFASDIIIRGFDTPAKIVYNETSGQYQLENFNYAGIVTKLLQPILPLFFKIQFNFLYDGYKNEFPIDIKAALGFLTIGSILLFLLSFEIIELGALGVSAEAFLGGELVFDFEAIQTTVKTFLENVIGVIQ